jgi:hypothetical protein
MLFGEDQAGQIVAPAEPGPFAISMLPDSRREVGGDPDGKNSTRPVRHDVGLFERRSVLAATSKGKHDQAHIWNNLEVKHRNNLQISVQHSDNVMIGK